MLNLFRGGSGSAEYARGDVDQPASGIAAPEVAAQYFRRLRLYNASVVASGLIIVGASVCAVFLHGLPGRIIAFVVGVLLAVGVSAASQLFFRCPACDYVFWTGWLHTEPKWHACPSCGIQFTAERKLRWPAL